MSLDQGLKEVTFHNVVDTSNLILEKIIKLSGVQNIDFVKHSHIYSREEFYLY